MQNKIYLVHPSISESGTLETLPNPDEIQLIEDTKLTSSNILFNEHDKVCITSEASLDIVSKKLKDGVKRNAINSLKDKYKFRQILLEMYPEYSCRKIDLDEIENLKIEKKTILKPQKGCFGTAVKILDKNSDLKSIVLEVKNELKKNSTVLSESVLSKNDFILEDFITGEEYAVDMFYDQNGDPHIVNIYYHPMPKVNAYLHMIYYTSKNIFDEIYDKAILFYKRLNKILKVKNFVLHCEFKYDEELMPIEINPMRFGGMGLGNMIYHAVGVNPYHFFSQGKSPNWKQIWQKYKNDNFAFFIAYNATDINIKTHKPDVEKLKKEFTKVLNEELFDYKKQLVFGIFTIKETIENIDKLLKIEFNDYFKPNAK